MLKLKETMRLKLLADSPERNAWSQPQNLSKDKQLFEAKRVALSEEVMQRYQLHEHPHGDDLLGDADMERSPIRTDGSTRHADRSISNA